MIKECIKWSKRQRISQENENIIKEAMKYVQPGLQLPNSSKWIVRFAGLSGAAAIMFGAYGAHAFYHKDVSDASKNAYETGNRYHLIHTLAILASPLCRKPLLVACTMGAGMIIFSGSCYFYALYGSQRIKGYTPYGGMLLIMSWLFMLL